MYALGKYNPSTGAWWKKKKDKKINNRAKGQTAGKTKGEACHASSLDRHMAKASRSYKHPSYNAWLAKVRAMK